MNAGVYGPPSFKKNVRIAIANNSAIPTAPKPGDFWWNNEDGRLKIWYQDDDTGQWVDAWPLMPGATGPTGSTGATGPFGPKAVSVPAPLNTDIVTMFHTNAALTLAEIRTVVRGSSPSVTTTWYWGADRTGTGNTTIQASIITTNTTSGNIQTSFSNSTPVANVFIWFNITAVSGSVDEFAATMRFT